MDFNKFLPKAKELVATYTNENADSTEGTVTTEDVYVVWYSKTLHNAKALLSTPLMDGMYYEVTLNGAKGEIYFDAYKKEHNMKVEWSE